jgi:Family of unknown function (DUF5985)
VIVATGFLLGAVAAAALVAALFFLRFWRQSGDRLFLLFAGAFALEALSRLLLATAPNPSEGQPLYYTLRLVAYGALLVGIVDKNVRRG